MSHVVWRKFELFRCSPLIFDYWDLCTLRKFTLYIFMNMRHILGPGNCMRLLDMSHKPTLLPYICWANRKIAKIFLYLPGSWQRNAMLLLFQSSRHLNFLKIHELTNSLETETIWLQNYIDNCDVQRSNLQWNTVIVVKILCVSVTLLFLAKVIRYNLHFIVSKIGIIKYMYW